MTAVPRLAVDPSDRTPRVDGAPTPAPAPDSRVPPPKAVERDGGGPLTIGVDLSLEGTGIASSSGWCERIETKKTGHARLSAILAELSLLVIRDAQLIVIEGLYGIAQPGQHERVGLLYLFTHGLWTNHRPFVIIPPASLKKYATGHGGSAKDAVLIAAIRRFPQYDIGSNDEADAVWLAAMGCDHLGHPLVDMPNVNRKALAAVQWPEMVSC